MTTQPYDDLLPEVVPYVRDCPEIVALNALRNAAIEFCDKSHWYAFQHNPQPIVANVSDYEFVPPDDTVVARVLEMWVSTWRVVPKSAEQLAQIFPLNWMTQQGQPQYYTQLDDPTLFKLVPYPAVTDGSTITLNVALRPSRDSTTLDCSLVERWAEQLAYGARARLYDTPGQPYYDPQTAMKYRAMFLNGIGEAKIERNRGLTRTTLRVSPPQLF